MIAISTITDAYRRLRQQISSFRRLLSVRGFRVRSGYNNPEITHPNWQLIIVVAISLIGLGFLFADDAAGHWKSTVSPEIYHFFRALTSLGKSEILLIPAALAILCLGLFPWQSLPKGAQAILCQFQMLGLYVVLAIAGSGLTNNLIKMTIGRARPRHFEQLGAFHFEPPGFSSGFQSFPSGHSTTAGAMAIVFILLFPKFKWTWLAIAAWIAGSRVIVGAHYPSDSVAGFVYGASFAWLLAVWFANRRLLFRAQGGLIRIPKNGGLSLTGLYKALHMLRQKA
ncbi:phosphatase PAP2 family protein [Cohaesibacter celericrescens]|uniref:Phosphatidic acid phosphatase type 2/haloperoxidase domain-containing protein n=1 Tax=Cohaesibacter celericrescens TaxID=2067669 RepID=A0A2N5XTR9_9HYPH|nr:phosphatase PAP2 family protein [Cohaesibacter celericrescens]PLW77904.1 hypothetical protein C0081_07200 [Cohaesibacter celericrescens]